MPTGDTFTLRNARIIFRNFSGVEGPMNKAGDRNFCVMLSPLEADILTDEGYNVKMTKPREDDTVGQPYLPVTLKYKAFPPKVVLITHVNRTLLEEEDLHMLDKIDFAKVDLIVRKREWEVNGQSGIKAYVKTIYITMAEDELELEYDTLEDLPTRSGKVEGDD